MWNESNLTCSYGDFSKNMILQADERSKQLPYIIVGIVFSILGIIANLHVIIALWGFLEDKQLTFTIYLKALSQSDFFACMGMFAKLFAEHYLCPQAYDKSNICYITNYLGYVSSMWSMWLVVAISYDRYRHICKPLQTQHTGKTTWAICGLSALLAAVSAIPVLFIYGIRRVRIDGTVYALECGISDSVRNTYFPLVFYICCDVSFFFLPVSVSLMYIKIRQTVIVGVESRNKLERAGRMAALRFQSESGEVRAEHNDEGKRKADSQNLQEKTTKLTRIPILITIFYSFSYATILLIETFNSLSGNEINVSRSKFTLFRYGFYGVFINNIVNPFIYVFNHSKLRSGILKMYTCKRCR